MVGDWARCLAPTAPRARARRRSAAVAMRLSVCCIVFFSFRVRCGCCGKRQAAFPSSVNQRKVRQMQRLVRRIRRGGRGIFRIRCGVEGVQHGAQER